MEKWNGKVRCVYEYNKDYYTYGAYYNIENGYITDNIGCRCHYNDLNHLNERNISKFEEVKEDKIVLLNKDDFRVKVEEIEYAVSRYKYETVISIKRNNTTQHFICWGEKYNQTLEDVQPILDALNIEIKEPSKTYKIDIEGTYTEKELENLVKSGIKFKKVEVQND